MKAAVVVEPGRTPVYSDFKEPVPATDEIRITVSAAALSNVVKSRASGKHYSSSGNFPFVAGIDGVGCLDDGRRVYFVLPNAPLGSIANPGMSAWAALRERAKLAAGETVVVNGATGTAGRLATRVMRANMALR